MSAKTASVGVDVDALKYYFQIHGIPVERASDEAWSLGVPRFLSLFDEVGCKATFYCVASDLVSPVARKWIQEITRQGHEVGNHSLDHDYRLTRLSDAEIYHQVSESRVQLETVAGQPVVGFRAPGYHINGTVLRAAKASGHLYDSSVFPCVPYYMAKAGVMGLMKLRGRASRSILGTPKSLTAPRTPYVADDEAPYRRASTAGLQEFPISVVAGVPLIGTAFTALGGQISAAITRSALMINQHLTLEFHAADLLSINEDGLDSGLSVQPDLNISWLRKREIYAKTLGVVNQYASFRRLDELVERS
ncbi:MAG: polysaccharide deacetylase family protein [Bradymonadia bacterium]